MLLGSLFAGVSQVDGRIVLPHDARTIPTRDVIDPSGKLLTRVNPDLTKTYYVYGLGLLYVANQADATKTYHFDQVGSTLLRTNDSGTVIGQAEYSAYGIMFWSRGDMASPFLYNGQAGVQTDPNGLLNMRARYYSPYLMRFLNADPIGFSGGSNWFAYADGNPISLNDPFGLCAQSGWSQAGQFASDFGQGLLDYTWSDMGSQILSITRAVGDAYPQIGGALSEINRNMPLEALGPNPGMFFAGGGQALSSSFSRISSLISSSDDAALAANRVAPAVSEGTSVFRVWGDEAGAWGRSWTTVDPRTVPNFRNAAGLPTQNSGRFVTEGTLQNTRGVTTQAATPLHGNAGGLPEVVIPNSASQVRPLNVQGLNPPF